MTSMSSSPLAQAIAALRDGRDEDAHLALAAAWRERRASSLAELATLLDHRTPSKMSVKLRAMAASKRVSIMLERFAELAHQDDPLLATFVLHALETPPFTGPSSRPLLEALIDAAERLRDPRLVEHAPAIARVWSFRVTPKPSRVALTERLEKAAAKLAKKPPRAATPEESDLEATLTSNLRSVLSRERTTADLFNDVYENPGDDGLRLVLADHLLERGDPRGELIMLQFARRRAAAVAVAAASSTTTERSTTTRSSRDAIAGEPSERERTLLKMHGKEWIGPLAPVLSWGKGYSESRFERGFLAIADVMLSVGKKLDLVLDEPSWAVVEEMRGHWPRAMLFRSPLRGLTTLDLNPVTLIELANAKKRFPCLEQLSTLWAESRDGSGGGGGGASFVPRDFFSADVFPALKTLILTMECGPSTKDVASLLDLPIKRLVLQRYAETAERTSRMPFETLVEEVSTLPVTIPEIVLEPPWKRWPRPEPVVLRAEDGRYCVIAKER